MEQKVDDPRNETVKFYPQSEMRVGCLGLCVELDEFLELTGRKAGSRLESTTLQNHPQK